MRISILVLTMLGSAVGLAESPPPGLTQGPDALAQLDALYAQRESADAARELEVRLNAELKATPDSFDHLWRLAQLKYWQADGAPEHRRKRQLAKESWAAAERAVVRRPDRVEGHYFAAIAIGAYSQAVGILKALGEGLEGKFNQRLERALALEAGFDRGGPLMAQGRYHFELPWPKRDLAKSKQLLERCIKEHPESLRARYYLADTLLAEGEAKKAKAQVELVLSGEVGYNPPEARRVQQWATHLLPKIEEELK